ncbi:unnamed protein product, partial [marine sediment metagenome]
CTSSDNTVVLLFNTPPNADAGSDVTLNCTTTSIQLSGSSSTITGSLGSYNLVETTGSGVIMGDVHAGNNVVLNGTDMTGNITAAGSTGTVVSVGGVITGNIDANGDINSSGTITGTVTHPIGTTYSGTVPGGGEIIGTPNIPVLPPPPADPLLISNATGLPAAPTP